MTVGKKQIDSLLNSASEAATTIVKHVEEGKTIHVATHLDADGLAAAGIIGKSLFRLGATFRLRIERWLDEKIIDGLAGEKLPLIILLDLGSGYLDLLNTKLSNHNIIILDHHQPVGEASPNCTQVNPHLSGIDGSLDLSGAGVAYFVAKAIDEKNADLAGLAVIGALGDIQDKYEQRKLGGVNEKLVEDAIETGHLKVETDLLLFGRETRPIHRALALTTNPFIPGISGEEDKSLAFLTSLKITPKRKDKWRALKDLSDEEKRNLFSALAEYLASKGLSTDIEKRLVGNIYTLTKEEPSTPLRDAREFTVLLNATGRMGKAGLGAQICMGDRGAALEEANVVLKEYRRAIATSLNWLNEKPERIEERDNIYIARGNNSIDDKMISAVSTILSTTVPNPEKPIIAYSKIEGEDSVKISARTLDVLTMKGLNLGEIMRIAAEKHAGTGGGHNIAAGGQVPISNLEPFLKLVDKLIKKHLERT